LHGPSGCVVPHPVLLGYGIYSAADHVDVLGGEKNGLEKSLENNGRITDDPAASDRDSTYFRP
jgi:hypothetical protein